jgi:predicted transcriptional regulator
MDITREQWIAQAEQYVRTSCYTSQRVTATPNAWLTDTDLDEARTLVAVIVRKTRTALSKAGRANARINLNAHGRDAAGPYADITALSIAWGHIATYANSVQAAPEETARLESLHCQMVAARDAAAEEALHAAIEREVAKRNAEGAWERELERRAGVGRPNITTIRA